MLRYDYYVINFANLWVSMIFTLYLILVLVYQL